MNKLQEQFGNRELKFRAWDKRTNEMFTELNIDRNGNVCVFMGEDKCVLFQFTGLKDKNGVEIYEGDILDYPSEETILLIRWDTTGANWQFDEYGIPDDGVGRGNWDFKLGIAKKCKVIGNIFENIDLLDEK